MCGPHASLCSSAASHPTYGPSHPDPAGGSFKQNRISSVSEQLFSFSRLYLIENRWGHLFHDFGPAEPEGRSQTRPVEQRSHAQLFPLIKLQQPSHYMSP